MARLAALLCTLALAALAACGEDTGSGPVTLDWFIFNEPSQAPAKVAERCSEQSGGRYEIEFRYLPSSADAQREQLVRRLAAEDDTIDIVGMDIIWTGEFANAGWIRPVPDGLEQGLEGEVFDSVLDSARSEGELYAVPLWSNTQLLWYRTDRVDSPPETWDEMLEQAERLGPEGTIQVQADRYEGLVVWTNAMIASAGTRILDGPQEVALEQAPTERALALMGRVSREAGAPDVTTSTEDSARLGFESGGSSFMLNYPFVYPSAEQNAPEVFENIGAALYPRVDADRPSAPPLGGINLAVSSFSPHGDLAFEAIECLVRPENQLTIAESGGLPPVNRGLYDEPELERIYPGFAGLIRESIEAAVPRPSESPAYQDLSLAIQRAVHPTSDIDPDDPTPTYERLRSRVEQAVERRGLL